MKKTALYARVGSDAQQKEATIESQLFALKKQIAPAGDVLVMEYIDDRYTRTLLDCPALEQMRADLKTDLFDAVYFHSADRIARDVAHQIIIVGELRSFGQRPWCAGIVPVFAATGVGNLGTWEADRKSVEICGP